jgi:predicted nucleotidyltransferase
MIALLEESLQSVSALCKRYRVARLDVFGSAARGNFASATSDLDFIVTFEPMPPADHADAYFGLLEGLESLFDREIDLIEEEAIKNPYFHRSASASRVQLYAA